jgi:hypothetical protein
MKGLLSIFILLFVSGNLFSQEMTELERRNGFKDIKLGMSVDSISGLVFKKEFKEKDEFDAKLYEVQGDAYKQIGDVEIKHVEVKAYKNLVYEISVVTVKDSRLMKALESIYGQAEYDARNDLYSWRGRGIGLKFKARSKSHLEMIYQSTVVFNMMKEDKAKKVKAIANDF